MIHATHNMYIRWRRCIAHLLISLPLLPFVQDWGPPTAALAAALKNEHYTFWLLALSNLLASFNRPFGIFQYLIHCLLLYPFRGHPVCIAEPFLKLGVYKFEVHSTIKFRYNMLFWIRNHAGAHRGFENSYHICCLQEVYHSFQITYCKAHLEEQIIRYWLHKIVWDGRNYVHHY